MQSSNITRNGVSYNWTQNTKNSICLGFDKFAYSKKRQNGLKNILVCIIAIVCALIVSLFVAMAVYGKPSLFGSIIEQIFVTPFDVSYWKTTISSITIFAIAALSFIFAERVGLFNIGISGQMLFGAQIAILVAWFVPSVPNVLGQLLIIFVAMACGALLAYIVAALKVYLNINEVITSIMFNWIVYFCGSYMMNTIGAQKGMIDASGTYTSALGDNFHIAISSSNGTLDGSWLPLLIILIIAIVGAFMILNVSAFGKKASSIGRSVTASQYAGINVNRQRIITMIISGALAGLLGAILYVGKDNALPVTVIAKTVPQDGFNGISVGLIAMSNPIAVLPISVLFSMIDTSKATIAQVCGVDANLTNLMFGIVVYGAAIITVFYRFRPFLWFKKLTHWKDGDKLYTEYVDKLQDAIKNASDAKYYFTKTSKDLQKLNSLKKKIKYLETTNKISKNTRDYANKKLEIIKKCSILKASKKYINNQVKVQLKALQTEYAKKEVNIQLANKLTKLWYAYYVLRNKINASLSAKSNVELIKSLNVDVTKLHQHKYLFVVIHNINRYYSLEKAIISYKYKFNLKTSNEIKYDNKFKNILVNNKNSKIVRKLHMLNTISYSRYNQTISKIINIDPINFGISYSIKANKPLTIPHEIVLDQFAGNFSSKIGKFKMFTTVPSITTNAYKSIWEDIKKDKYLTPTYEVLGPKTSKNDSIYPMLKYRIELANNGFVVTMNKSHLLTNWNSLQKYMKKYTVKCFKKLAIHKHHYVIYMASYEVAIKSLENAKKNFAREYAELVRYKTNSKKDSAMKGAN